MLICMCLLRLYINFEKPEVSPVVEFHMRYMMSQFIYISFISSVNFIVFSQKVKWSEVAQLCPTLSDPMDCSPPGSSIHGIFQARVLEWDAIAFSVFPERYILKVFPQAFCTLVVCEWNHFQFSFSQKWWSRKETVLCVLIL